MLWDTGKGISSVARNCTRPGMLYPTCHRSADGLHKTLQEPLVRRGITLIRILLNAMGYGKGYLLCGEELHSSRNALSYMSPIRRWTLQNTPGTFGTARNFARQDSLECYGIRERVAPLWRGIALVQECSILYVTDPQMDSTKHFRNLWYGEELRSSGFS